jgi:hypothetical protein
MLDSMEAAAQRSIDLSRARLESQVCALTPREMRDTRNSNQTLTYSEIIFVLSTQTKSRIRYFQRQNVFSRHAFVV